MNMKKKQVALIAGVTIGIAAGQASAPAAIIYQDDYDDLSQLTGAFGGAAAATDTETDSRTVLAHDGPNGAQPNSTFMETQKAFSPLSLDGNPDSLVSFTVDTVVRRNQSVHPPNTIFLDYRNDGNGAEEFQRLTIQVQSNSSGTSIDEFKGVDTGVQNHFGGLLSPHFPHTDSASDYSTFRLKYEYATSRFTVSTIINSVETTVASFALANPTGAQFDRMRYRWQGSASDGPADSGWFIDSTLITTVEGTPPPPIAVTTSLVDNVVGLTFDSEDGKDYQLESTTDNVNWTAANFTIHGLGQTETTQDLAGNDPNKNYRIVTLP
jgi:hypothetical protein